MIDLSVAIPTYEMNGVGPDYLRELFASIAKQTFKTLKFVSQIILRMILL